ncbi:hypothetical protein ACFE04_007445 [Oxalis oulophora]
MNDQSQLMITPNQVQYPVQMMNHVYNPMNSVSGPNRMSKHVTKLRRRCKAYPRRIPLANNNSNIVSFNLNLRNNVTTNCSRNDEFKAQNRMKPYFNRVSNYDSRYAPYAPRNTSSYLIRAKKSGGIASLVSPVMPAVLPTPTFSPWREVLGDMVKEEWGVDGYGSMKGFIRLRPTSGNNMEDEFDEEQDEVGNGSFESDTEERIEVERRLDHDLSRFEMIYPNCSSAAGGSGEYTNSLESRIDNQDSHIVQLKEDNLISKERLSAMEMELSDLRRKLLILEKRNLVGIVNEEVVEKKIQIESDDASMN